MGEGRQALGFIFLILGGIIAIGLTGGFLVVSFILASPFLKEAGMCILQDFQSHVNFVIGWFIAIIATLIGYILLED